MTERPEQVVDVKQFNADAHSLLPDWLNAHRDEINDAIARVLNEHKPVITELALDAAGRGRKLRGTLALQLFEWCEWDLEDANRVELLKDIAKIEILHSLSCALDDLIDQDDMRRGEPSFPVRNGKEATIRLTTYFVIHFGLQPDFNKMLTDVVTGEAFDSFLLAKHGIDNYEDPVGSYLQKAAPTFALAHEVAAKQADRSESEIKRAGLYGGAIGKYYQVSNDHHDCFTIPVDARGPMDEMIPLNFSIPFYLYWKKKPEFEKKLGSEVTRQELSEIVAEMKEAGIEEESEQFVQGLRAEIEANFPGDTFPEELGGFLDMVNTSLFWSYKYSESSSGS